MTAPVSNHTDFDSGREYTEHRKKRWRKKGGVIPEQ
jgi:hypothetical protein